MLVSAMDCYVVSPSLLKQISERECKPTSSLFCLGLPEFCNCEKYVSN